MKILPKTMLTLFWNRYHDLEVKSVIAHAENCHPEGCPLIPNCVALEIFLECGCKRWIGCKRAAIGSDLRMHFEPISENDEVINKYEDDNGIL